MTLLQLYIFTAFLTILMIPVAIYAKRHEKDNK